MVARASKPATPVVSKKVTARVALVNLDEATAAVLQQGFRQFNIEAVKLQGDGAARLRREKFEGCALRLGDSAAESILRTVRTSSSNFRIVVYGVSSSVTEALRFSKYCINAVFDAPVERQAAARVIRSTYLLVVHELRRYVRVPVVTAVRVKWNGEKYHATSQEISAGGMSIKMEGKIKKQQPVEVTFSLPDVPAPLWLQGTVSWLREAEQLVGVRFDPGDELRVAVKRWIDNYLEID